MAVIQRVGSPAKPRGLVSQSQWGSTGKRVEAQILFPKRNTGNAGDGQRNGI